MRFCVIDSRSVRTLLSIFVFRYHRHGCDKDLLKCPVAVVSESSCAYRSSRNVLLDAWSSSFTILKVVKF